MWAKQLHNAHHLDEVIIRYRFHPRCGEIVIVAGRNHRGDEVSLTIRQPDGTLTRLPIWMTEDRAAAMTVRERPHLSLACLCGLRRELDTCQSLLRDNSCREGDKHAASEPCQPDLFALDDPPVPLAEAERMTLVPLVSMLLKETLAVITETEASDDEDHA